MGGLVVAASILIPVRANADAIDFRQVGHASVVTLAGTIFNGSVWAGELNWQWVGTPPEGFARDFYSYCVDLGSYLRDPQSVSIVDPDGFTNGLVGGGANAAYLFEKYAAGIRSNMNAALANTQAAALQVAIWEAMYDSWDVSTSWWNTGSLRLVTNNGIRTYANAYLTDLAGASVEDPQALILSTSYGQDQITHGVSEPSTLLLMGVAFIVFSRLVRRPTGIARTEI